MLPGHIPALLLLYLVYMPETVSVQWTRRCHCTLTSMDALAAGVTSGRAVKRVSSHPIHTARVAWNRCDSFITPAAYIAETFFECTLSILVASPGRRAGGILGHGGRKLMDRVGFSQNMTYVDV